ncbi:DUF3105 domain-containing protein [Spirillospora sp. CA-294931]|uniref:DUF3105 domain-containing protein n=1 Tax=Spirillospora sp. CA-294931 TaxID=3240042 RepID=UPI003D908F70
MTQRQSPGHQGRPASSGPDGGDPDLARRERLAVLRRGEARRARRERRLVVGAIALMATAGLAVAGWAVNAAQDGGGPGGGSAQRPRGPDPDKANVPGERVYPNQARGHRTGGVRYPANPNPPVGGVHDPVWQNAGGDVYERPLRPEHAVHSLEHGAVWVTYGKGATAAEIATFEAKVHGVPYRFMSPNPGQTGAFVLTAWGHQLSVTSATDPSVDRFLGLYTSGPQAQEPGGPVTGGRAEP